MAFAIPAIQWTAPTTLLRLGQLFFAILVLGLSAAAISGTESHQDFDFFSFGGFYYGVDALALFTACFTLIAVPLLLFAISATVSPYLWYHALLEILLNIFWFSTWIAQAAVHGGTTCHGFSPNFCACGKASAAMGALCWALFMISSFFIIKALLTEFHIGRKGVAAGEVAPADVEAGETTAEMKEVPHEGGVVHPSEPVTAAPLATEPVVHNPEPVADAPVTEPQPVHQI